MLQSVPSLSQLFDVSRVAQRMLGRLGSIPILILSVFLLPVNIIAGAVFHPHRARALSTIVLFPAACAAVTGEICRLRWPNTKRSIREVLLQRGGSSSVWRYSSIIIVVGGLIVPAAVMFACALRFPRTSAWLTDGIGILRVIKYLSWGATIGFVSASIGIGTAISSPSSPRRDRDIDKQYVDVTSVVPPDPDHISRRTRCRTNAVILSTYLSLCKTVETMRDEEKEKEEREKGRGIPRSDTTTNGTMVASTPPQRESAKKTWSSVFKNKKDKKDGATS